MSGISAAYCSHSANAASADTRAERSSVSDQSGKSNVSGLVGRLESKELFMQFRRAVFYEELLPFGFGHVDAVDSYQRDHIIHIFLHPPGVPVADGVGLD